MKKALTRADLLNQKSVRRDAHEPTDTCVIHTAEVCLSPASFSPAAIS
jgi:hypothetical protein